MVASRTYRVIDLVNLISKLKRLNAALLEFTSTMGEARIGLCRAGLIYMCSTKCH
jgi:hypothetical protein